MNILARHAVAGVLVALLSAHASAADQPMELRSALPTATLAGSTRFTVWGFGVYDARLWIDPGFDANAYDSHGFALELTYLRDFSNDAITDRSIDEMQRLAPIPEAKRARWRQSLREAFPNVRKGDRITGINRPGVGAVFMTNGRPTGDIRDPEFARQFFGIWLSARTSEPRLRAALLAPLAPQ